MKLASSLLAPLLLSFFLTLILLPVMRVSRKKNIPEWLTITSIVAFLVVTGLTLTTLLSSSMHDLTDKAPLYSQNFSKEFEWISDGLENNKIPLTKEFIASHIEPSALIGAAIPLLSGLTNIMSSMLLVIVTVIFMLLESRQFSQKLTKALNPNKTQLTQSLVLIESINNYIRMKTLVSAGTGILAGALCFLIGLEHFALWGLLTFIFNYIPNVGSFLISIPVVILAIVDVSFYSACILAIGLAATNLVMGNIVEPKYVGRGLGLSTLVVFISLLAWGWIFGLIGMILSVPLTMALKLYFESSPALSWLSALMDSDSEAPIKR